MPPTTLKKSAVSVPVLSEDDIPILPEEDVEDIVGGDEAAGRFFSDAPVALPSEPVHVVEIIDDAPRQEIAARSRAERERRRYLTRYVVSAVALSAVICVAAVVHATGMRVGATALREASAPSLAPATLAAAAAAEPPIEPKVAPAPTTDTVATTPVAPPAEPARVPEVAPAAVEGVVPAAAPAPALVGEIAGAKPDSGSGATDEPSDPHAALKAKQESQRALDLGKVALSIEAGERSVQLDASDAEAWLILGAAYMQHGRGAQARRSFTSCVQLAKRGPRNECAALLR
jgi:hypothetical protein